MILAGSAQASATTNLSNPFPVVLESNGVPATGQGTFTGSGFAAGTGYYVELCDGANPAAPNWSPNSDCSNANGVSYANSSGNLTINTNANPFSVFHGQEPNDLFNCLAPSDNPNATTTVVGGQTIDPNVPAWGSSQGASAGGGGTTPCQIRISSVVSAYNASDVYIPVTNLDGTAVTTAPQAPSNVSAAPAGAQGSGAAKVTFTPATSGTAAASYIVTADNTTTNTTSTSNTYGSPAAVGALTPGDSYTFTVTAVSAAHVQSAASAPSSAIQLPSVPAPTTPGTPTVTLGPGGSGTASLSWTPSSNTVSHYTVTGTSSGSGATVSGTSNTDTLTLAGLTIGQAYTFTVSATGPGGSSSASTASSPAATPANEPAPTGVTVTPVGDYGSGKATVSFAPGSDGQTPTSYTVTATPSSSTAVTATAAATTILLSDLTPGTAYSVAVTATTTPMGSSSNDTSAQSAPLAFTPPAVEVPPAPNISMVSTGTASATVAFATGDPQNPVTYTLTATPTAGGAPVTATGAISPLTATGLQPGAQYSFSVHAANAAAPAGIDSSSADLVTIPAAPTVAGVPAGAVAGNAYSYQFLVGGTATTITSAGSLPPGLTLSAGGALTGMPTVAGTYTFTVVAMNSVGSVTETATLTVVPGAPAKVVIERGNRQTASEGRAFARGLVVIVEDRFGNRVPGDRVTFRVTRGPARFGGSSRSVRTTSGSGVATAGRLVADRRPGTVTVSVTAAGVGGRVTYSLRVRR